MRITIPIDTNKVKNLPYFYVYKYTDAETNETLYIGKGHGKRAWSHLNRVDNHPLTKYIQRCIHHTKPLPNIAHIPCKHEAQAEFIEAVLIEQYNPPFNLVRGSKKVTAEEAGLDEYGEHLSKSAEWDVIKEIIKSNQHRL